MTKRIRLITRWLTLVSVAGWTGCAPAPDLEADGDLSQACVLGGKPGSPGGAHKRNCEILKGGKVNTGPLPEGCAKIEGGQIGQPGIQVAVDDLQVTLSTWQAKAGRPGEYIGFTYAAAAPVCVSVKAGKETFVAKKPDSWTHPAGTSGPRAHAISNVVLCRSGEIADDPDPGDGGEGEDDACPCGTLTCGPDPLCGRSCGTCADGYVCTPAGYCAIYAPH